MHIDPKQEARKAAVPPAEIPATVGKACARLQPAAAGAFGSR